MCRVFTDTYLQLFCEKNSDGTKNLRLKGKDFDQRTDQRIISEELPYIVKFLLKNPKVISVNLCYNVFGDDGFLYLTAALLHSRNEIQTLNVIKCGITANGLKNLPEVYETLKLKTLRLAGNRLGEDGGRLIALLLHRYPCLKYLDIGDTDQTYESLEKVIMVARFTVLTVLNISRSLPRHFIYQGPPQFIIEDLAEFLKISKYIREIHAQKMGFDGHDAEILINYGLSVNKSLRFLDLGYNRIGDFGINLIANWLKTKPELIGLNVAGNNINDFGGVALSLALPFSKIRLLDLSYNNIGDEGMSQILNTIKKPYQMRYLYIWGNSFKHETNSILYRLLKSGALNQECVDVKPYCIDGVWMKAQYPADHYKQRYYEVMDHACPIELLIKHNKLEPPGGGGGVPVAKVNFEHIDRFPPLL